MTIHLPATISERVTLPSGRIVLPFSYPAVARVSETSRDDFIPFIEALPPGGAKIARELRRELLPYAQAGMPAEIRRLGEQYAPELEAQLARFKTTLLRNQSVGSLDTSKLARLADPNMSAARFEREAATAYKRRGNVERLRKIRVALVADFNFQTRHANPTYVPTLGPLVQVLADACQIAGMECTAYGARGNMIAVKTGDAPCSIIATLKDAHEEMSGACFAMLTNESRFIDGYVSAFQLGRLQRPDLAQSDAAIASVTAQGSTSGAGGIDYAKSLGADFVIAVGKFPDDAERRAANVWMPAGTPLPMMVQCIANALANDGSLGAAA